MKILKRKEFLKLPEFTLYHKAEQYAAWEELCVFMGGRLPIDDTDSGDWVELRLGEVSDDLGTHDLENEMLDHGASHPMDDDATQRDALYQNDGQDCYKIYELGDLLKLRTLLERAIQVAEGSEYHNA